MKLHLPTSLRGALIACMGAVCITGTAYAADTNPVDAAVTHNIKLQGSGSSSEPSRLLAYAAGTDGSTTVQVNTLGATDKLQLTSSITGWLPVTTNAVTSYNAIFDLQNYVLTINNSNAGRNGNYTGTTFTNAIIGGTNSAIKYTGAPANQSYVFSGDLSNFYGTINITGTTNKLTFSTALAEGETSNTLNASSLVAAGTMIFDTAYDVAGSISAGTLDLNASLTVGGSVTVTGSLDLAAGVSLTFDDDINASLNLAGATLTTTDTSSIDLGNSATLQLKAANTYTAGDYTVGTLSYGDRDFNEVLVGLMGRQTASYSEGVVTVTGSGLDLTWNATADGTDWTAAGAWLNGSDTETFVNYDNSVTFGADAASKKVGITGNVAVANTINIEDDYEFNVTAASTITGLFNMTEGTTLTKTGSATLTIGTSDANNQFATLKVAEGTLTLNNATVGTLTSHANTTVNLNNISVNIGTLNVGGTVNIKGGSRYTGISAININKGGELVLASSDCHLITPEITIYGGGTLTSHCKWSLGSSGYTNIINIDAEDESAVIRGNYYGDLNIASDIQGKGTLEFQQCHNNHGNKIYVDQAVSDKDRTLAIKVTSGDIFVTSADNTYSGGTSVEGGKMTVTADKALGTGEVSVDGGTLVLSGTHTLDNTIKAGAVAEIGAEGASYTGVTITNATLSGGSITGADMDFSGAYALSNTTLTDVNITASAAASLTNSTVTLNGTNTLTLVGEAFSLTDGLLSTGVLSGMTLTGNVHLDFSSDLLAYVEQNLGEGNTLTISLGNLTISTAEATAFALDNSPITVSDALLASFGTCTLDTTSGVSLVFAGKDSDNIPEPTTATLSLLALVGLAARRRRK